MISLTRKYIAAFGSLFKDIQIREWDSKNNKWLNFIDVPVFYGNKEKMLARSSLRDLHGFNDDIATTTPRISFELTNIEYDSKRALNKQNFYVGVKNDDGNQVLKQHVAVPYNFTFVVSTLTKYMDHSTQIVESILPLFTPQINITLNITGINNIKFDVPIILTDVSYSDEYESDFKTRRIINWDLTFLLKGYFLAPIEEMTIIKKAIMNFKPTPTANTAFERLTTVPVVSGKQLGEILISDDYGFSTTNETIYE